MVGFGDPVHGRAVVSLAPWLDQERKSGLPEFAELVRDLDGDRDAVEARLNYNNQLQPGGRPNYLSLTQEERIVRTRGLVTIEAARLAGGLKSGIEIAQEPKIITKSTHWFVGE